MMPDDLTGTDELIVIATRLRAEGATWAAIAKAVGRAEDTVQAWPRKRPEKWYPALQQAVSELMPEIEREAVGVLRAGLRWHKMVGDKKMPTSEARKSSATLLRHLRECRAKSIEIGLPGGGLQIIITPAKAPEEEPSK